QSCFIWETERFPYTNHPRRAPRRIGKRGPTAVRDVRCSQNKNHTAGLSGLIGWVTGTAELNPLDILSLPELHNNYSPCLYRIKTAHISFSLSAWALSPLVSRP